MTEIVTAAALQRGHNVLVDGSLWDADWYRRYFEHLKKGNGSLRIAILHITAPREAVFERAMVSSGENDLRSMISTTITQLHSLSTSILSIAQK